MDLAQAEEIHDEYDIEVSSKDKEFRNQQIGSLISELNTINDGLDDRNEFNSWVFKSLKILLASNLVNIKISDKLNYSTIIARNMSNAIVWKDISQVQQTDCIMFDIHNKKLLEKNDYTELATRIDNNKDKIGFIVNRGHDNNISKDREVKWVREIYSEKRIIIIKLSSKFIERQLSKSRNPRKHDDVNKELKKLLSQYHNMWLPNKKK
jgi:hypothetical protein